jgi:hypothetical protein
MNATEARLPRSSRSGKRRTVMLAAALLPALLSAALSAAPARLPRITLLYTTAETTTTASVVWNTDAASDSSIQYSTSSPIPSSAPRLYAAAQVTYHEFALTGLAPGTLYYYRVTSCAKKGCATATGTFDTYPTCPDQLPPVSGSWQRVASPNVANGAVDSELLAVTAISENDVWAVGWSQEPNGPPYVKRSFIQHYDGSSWKIVPSPNPPNDTNTVLNSVSGTSAFDVWAVGTTHDGTFPSRTLILHWDGVRWSIVPSPSPDTQLNSLHAVVALSASDAWAVGYRNGTHSETPLETLTLRWNGATWSHVPSPNVAGGANQLFAIDAISASDIFSVGYVGGAGLILRWNGTAWSASSAPVRSGLSSETWTGVVALASNNVWAVGRGRGFFSNRAGNTVRRWNGTYWADKMCNALSPSNPPPDYEGGGPDSYINGVAASAANDVWAVGVSGSGPMIRHFDGVGWTSVIHPRAYPNSDGLWAVTALPSGIAWAVGYEIVFAPDGSVSPRRTLIFRYSP